MWDDLFLDERLYYPFVLHQMVSEPNLVQSLSLSCVTSKLDLPLSQTMGQATLFSNLAAKISLYSIMTSQLLCIFMWAQFQARSLPPWRLFPPLPDSHTPFTGHSSLPQALPTSLVPNHLEFAQAPTIFLIIIMTPVASCNQQRSLCCYHNWI